MNSVHDMGGMHGLGAVAPTPTEPVFRTEWEARVHALTLASPTRTNIDRGRHQRELIPGPAYLQMSYYEKWFTSLCALLVGNGFATSHEIAAGRAAPGSPVGTPLLAAGSVTAALTRPASYQRTIEAAPAFQIGDRVRTLNLNPIGHTRLPRYAKGRVGVVTHWHGAHVLPDSHAHDGGEDPRHLYCIAFTARELWGPEASARDTVRLDLWEPYLANA